MATQKKRYEDLPGLISLMTGDEKHSAGATSTLDVLWVLYDRVLRIDPEHPTEPTRDRFLLSKGHGPMAYFAVLAAKGFFPVPLLRSFSEFESPLGQHPDATLVPGVEIGSGSLGHGFPMAVGMTAALRAKQATGVHVYCLVGDAELDEGSNHEAMCVAGRLKLDKLTIVAVDNQSSSLGWPGGIDARFEAEGWSASVVDGRDHDAIEAGLRAAQTGRPHLVVAAVEGKD